MTTKHTPTPWYVEKATTMNFAHILDEGSRDLVASATPRHAVGSIDIDAGDANAQFIVRACNSHDALVGALKEVIEILDGADELSMPNYTNHAVGKLNDACNDAYSVIEAALAKAKEQS